MNRHKEQKSKPVTHEVEDGMLCGVGIEILEYFDSLNWNGPDVESNPTRTFLGNSQNINSRSLEDGPLNLQSLKLVNDELVPFSHNPKLYEAVTLPSPSTGVDLFKKDKRHYHVPGVESKLTEYPHKSTLSFPEQKKLFVLMLRTNLGLKLSTCDQTLFETLTAKVKLEELNYQHYVQSQWTRSHVNRCLQILPTVEEFMVNFWMAKRQKCMDMYPTDYKILLHGVRLAATDPYHNYAVFEFQREILKWGYKPRLKQLTFRTQTNLLTKYDDLVRLKPIITPRNKNTRPMCSESPVVSRDQNVMDIINTHDVDVVISSGSVKTLVCDSVAEPWYLPVTVKKVFNSAEGKEKKVVIVDKKLPKNFTSKHHLNLGHAKVTAKWVYILASHPRFYDLPDQEEDLTERKLISYDDLMASELDRIQLKQEDMGDSKISSKKPKGNSSEVPISSQSQVDEEEMSGAESVGDVEFARHRRASIHSSEESKPSVESTVTSHSGQSEAPRLYRPLRPCLVYNLFNLQKSNADSLLKQEKRKLNVLVRSRCDGIMRYSKGEKLHVYDTYISSKLEFQPEYGASRLTKKELLREYIDLRLRPENVLTRARFIGHTKEFMVQEVVTYAELCRIPNELVTNNLFDPMYSVLTKLIDLPEGQYLVCHGTGFFADIMAQTDIAPSHGFSMERYFFTLQTAELQLPPPLIDSAILTPIHHRHKMPPVVFHPDHMNKKPMPKHLLGNYLPLSTENYRKMQKNNKKVRHRRNNKFNRRQQARKNKELKSEGED